MNAEIVLEFLISLIAEISHVFQRVFYVFFQFFVKVIFLNVKENLTSPPRDDPDSFLIHFRIFKAFSKISRFTFQKLIFMEIIAMIWDSLKKDTYQTPNFKVSFLTTKGS